jgi:glycine/sarcosine N-methyltransferase
MKDYQEFYDSISDNYDLMTSDIGRWERERPVLLSLVEEFGWKEVLVAGCGTGGEVIILAQLGLHVAGVDGSFSLLQKAQEKAEKANIEVDWYRDDLRVLKQPVLKDFDAVICRGNTLPHFLTIDDLKAAVTTFKRTARSGGHLVLGWLNYRRILTAGERLVGAREFDDKVILRFYDFQQDYLVFNILTLARGASSDPAGKRVVSWHSTRLRPWTLAEVEPVLAAAGWEINYRWGGIDRAPFDVDTSHDVLVFAKSI